MNLLLVCFVFALAGAVSSTDLKSEVQSEQSNSICESLQVAPNVNTTWMKSSEIWFFPLISRSALISTAKLILPEAKFLRMSEDRMLKDNCFHMNWKSGEMFAFGKRVNQQWTFHFNSIRRGAIDWELDGEYAGSSYVIHTDNKSFAVGVDVFADGTRGGYVMIPYGGADKFSGEQISEWKKKLVEVGFKEGEIMESPIACSKKFWETRKASILKLDEESTEDLSSQAVKA